MKRVLAVLMLLVLLIPSAALAATPNPIPVIAKEDITPTVKGVYHYMLICVDAWHADPKNLGHTDGLVLVTVDKYAGRVMLTSFIRDMLIMRPDDKFGRINNIVGYFGANQQGVETLIDVIGTHFDLDIDYYIVVDFGQVEKIIDAIGGVDITVSNSEAQYLRNYAISPNSTTPKMGNGGTYHFGGHASVIYMRIRKVATIDGKTQDVGRTQRARTVLTTIADSLKDITYEQALDLVDIVTQNTVYTNMTSADLMAAVDMAMQLKGVAIEQIRMPIDGTYEPMPVSGMATQQLDFIANRKALHAFLFDSFVVAEED